MVEAAIRGRYTSQWMTLAMPRYTLETIILILVILWLLGGFVFPIGGSLIHLLLVVILIVVLLRLLQGRRAL
jgi:hypothetical protein